MVAVNSGKKTTLFQVANFFLIVRTPKMSKLKHSLRILVSNLTLRTDILLVLLLFRLFVVFIFSLLLPSVPSGHPCGTSDSECFNKRNAQLPEHVRIFWGLNGIYGRLLAWPSSHGKPLVGDDFVEFSTKNGPGKQYPRYTFPLEVGWIFVPKHPNSEIAQSRCFLSSLLIYK